MTSRFFLLEFFRQPIWTPDGVRALVVFSVAYWVFALWAPRYVRRVMLPLAGIWAIASVGLLPVLSVGLMLVAAYGLGFGIPAGLAAFAVVTSVLVRFPINYAPLYWLLVAIGLALAWRRRPTLPELEPPSFAESLVIYLGSIYLLAALFPEAGADGLSTRLTTPAWVANHGKWDFDPSHFSWAVMAMNGDWAFTFAYLLGGEAAARLLNFAMLALTAWTIYRLARHYVGHEPSLLAAALFLSTPVTYFVGGTLFVESFWTLLICAAVLEIAEGSRLWLAGALLGVAISAKLLAVAFAVPLAVAVFPRKGAWRAMAIALVLALPPYMEAWVKTGNPVFPLLNVYFRSPLFSTAMPVADVRYAPALSWDFLWVATFHTRRYLDGHDGSFGFHYLILLPVALLLWRRAAWLCLGVGLAGAMVILSQMAYLRYLLPGLALLCAAFAVVIEKWSTVALICLNTYFLAAGTSYTRDFWLPPFSARAREEYLREVAPIRKLVDYLNEHARGEPAAFFDDDAMAGLVGKPYAASWHTWAFLHALDEAASPDAVLALLQARGIRWVVASAPGNWYATYHVPARALLQACGESVLQNGNFAVWRIREACPADRLYMESAPVAAPGEHDDIDPVLRYAGPWLHDHQFAEAAGHTVTYTSTPGNFVQLRFRGQRVRIMYTAAANRGVGEVTIDGRVVGRLDQYSVETKWQSEAAFSADAPGEHVLRISLLPGSTAGYLDVDRITVE